MSDYTLLERLSGPVGEAYHWQYPDAGPDADTTISSESIWLIHLPLLDERANDPEGEAGVFVLSWKNHEHRIFEKWRNHPTPLRERWAGAYGLSLLDAYGENVQATDPRSFDDCGDPLLAWNGSDRAAADQLMRLWVDALLSGELDPYLGWVADPESPLPFMQMEEAANADPTAHLRSRVFAPPSNQPALF